MSTQSVFEVEFKERNIWLLHEQDEGPPMVRPEYAQFVCKTCDKLDELRSLKSGPPQNLTLPRMDLDGFSTEEFQVVVSSRGRDLFSAIDGAKVQFFPLKTTSEFFVMYPGRVVYPPAGTRVMKGGADAKEGEAFQLFGKPCKTCGRAAETGWSPAFWTPPKDLSLLGVAKEEGWGVLISWVVNKGIADTIKQAKLKGIKVSRLE